MESIGGNLYVRGGRVVTSHGRFRADVLILNGRIAAVEPPGAIEAPPRVAELDASGCYLLPGLVDVHAHFREPGMEEKEDLQTGSASAAVGGVTTVLEMPNTDPPVSTPARLREKAARLRGRSYVDIGLYGVVLGENVHRLAEMVSAGAVALKVFGGPTTGGLRAPGWAVLREVLQAASSWGVRVAFHAEDEEVVLHGEERLRAHREAGYDDLLACRPAYAEASSVARAVLLSAETRCPVHICHCSSALGLEAIAWGKSLGAPVTAETCPQYLLLTDEDFPRLGSRMKVFPPIRTPEDQAALWKGLVNGTLDMIASDHAPHLAAEKEGPLLDVPAGVPGIETTLPLLLDQVHAGRLDLESVVRLTSLNPARAFGLDPRKGRLAAGGDGDMVVVDMDASWTMRGAESHSRARWTPWEGRSGRGRPVATVLRGRVVVREGSLVAEPHGEWLTPSRRWS